VLEAGSRVDWTDRVGEGIGAGRMPIAGSVVWTAAEFVRQSNGEAGFWGRLGHGRYTELLGIDELLKQYAGTTTTDHESSVLLLGRIGSAIMACSRARPTSSRMRSLARLREQAEKDLASLLATMIASGGPRVTSYRAYSPQRDDTGRTLPELHSDVDYWVHHTSFLSGQPVAAAGEIEVSAGRIVAVSNASGHYQPQPGYLLQFLLALRKWSPFFDLSTFDVEAVEDDSVYNAHEFFRKAPHMTREAEAGSGRKAKPYKTQLVLRDQKRQAAHFPIGYGPRPAPLRPGPPPPPPAPSPYGPGVWTVPESLEDFIPAMPAGYGADGRAASTALKWSGRPEDAGIRRRDAHYERERTKAEHGGQRVKYLDERERRFFELRLRNDRLEIGCDTGWAPLDTAGGGMLLQDEDNVASEVTSRFIYVLSPEGKLYAGSVLHMILGLNRIRAGGR